MNGKLIKRLPFRVALVFFVALWFSSCKTTRELPTAELKSVSTSKLLKMVEKNAFDYKYFTVKRINCQYSDGDSRTTFKVNLKAERDKNILVSISKLSIPVGRLLLTPDSVKYVNYLEQNYFVDDYSYLSDFLNIDLDFETIQAIISNNAFSYRNDPRNKDFRTFDSFTEDGKYVLQTEKTDKIEKMNERGKDNKIRRRLNRLDDNALIIQKMFFEPRNFAMTRFLINDKTNNRFVEMDFDDFEKMEDAEYPGSIEMNFVSPGNTISVKLKMSGLSTEKISSFSLNIPEKYDQIHVN